MAKRNSNNSSRGGEVYWATIWLVELTFYRIQAALTLASAAPDIIPQQANFILQVWTHLEAAFFPRVQCDLKRVDVTLHASQCILGMILQPVQLILHLPAQLAVLSQKLHLRQNSVEVLTVMAGLGLDLTNVLAEVQNLGENEINIKIIINNDFIQQKYPLNDDDEQ